MKTWISAVTAIAVLGCVEQAVAKGTPNDDLGSALSDLAAYARASGTLFVAEARCHTGNEEAIRASVLVNASAYVKPDKLQQFVSRTFDEQIKRISLDPHNEPCKVESLHEYRKFVPKFLAMAKAGFAAAHYPK